jgi:DNA-binding NarL/FixJ family response regulator
MMYPIKVFIIDDDFYVRQATTSLLTRDERTEVVGSASSIAEAMVELDTLIPDIILLDLDFKHTRESGLEAIIPLKNLLPQTGILIFSASRDENSILEAMQAGADGYIWKNDAAEGLGSAIERVKDGSFVITESIARLIYGKFSGLIDERPAEILPEGKHYFDLTKRVGQVMRLYCFENMSALEIAETLHLSENTVRGYIKAGYEVVGANSRREAFKKLIARADE